MKLSNLWLAISLSLSIVLMSSGTNAENILCFESLKGASEVVASTSEASSVNIKCSPKTGAVLWWDDPFENTISLGNTTIPDNTNAGEAVARPRTGFQKLYPLCGLACHNGSYPPLPKDRNPRQLTMHLDIVPDPLNLQHGNQGIWCMDCHHATDRKSLVDNFGNAISFDEPQKLCGKCHGSTFRDWRDGIHGKRIGEWASTGKKRWFVCTECHNPHDVQQGSRKSGFVQLMPEPAPMLPKGVLNRDHELKNADGSWKKHYLPADH